MTKFVLYSAGAFEWSPEGVFDTREDVHNWIKETYDYSFEDFLEEEPGSTFEDWYGVNEIKVEEIIYYPKSELVYVVYSDWEQQESFQTLDEAYEYISESAGTLDEFIEDFDLDKKDYSDDELINMWLEEYEFKIEEVPLPK
jgi:hypothetical protein